MKIGILEDDPFFLEWLKERVEDNEKKVICAKKNGKDFIQSVNENKPDAIICDIDIGGNEIDGLNIAYRFKVPVLFFSGHNAKHLAAIETLKHESLFHVDHVTKPCSEERFNKAFKKFLKRVEDDLDEKNSKIVVKFIDKGKDKLNEDDIVCIYKKDKNLMYAYKNINGVFVCNKVTGNITGHIEERRLNKKKFWNINQSTIININFFNEKEKKWCPIPDLDLKLPNLEADVVLKKTK